MDREYDIFEKFSDGKLEWRCFVTGLKAARVRLKLLAARSRNEFFAIHTPTKEIAARANDEKATN